MHLKAYKRRSHTYPKELVEFFKCTYKVLALQLWEIFLPHERMVAPCKVSPLLSNERTTTVVDLWKEHFMGSLHGVRNSNMACSWSMGCMPGSELKPEPTFPKQPSCWSVCYTCITRYFWGGILDDEYVIRCLVSLMHLLI
jgi:hypothetical protein